jgi:hypothetical protein
MEQDKGKTTVKKVGLAPVQRDGMEYEFDVVADMTLAHDFIVSKTRCPALDDKMFHKPGAEVAAILKDWLTDGVAAIDAPPPIGKEGQEAILASLKDVAQETRKTEADLQAGVMVILRKHGKGRVHELTQEQAQEVRDYLRDQAKQAEREEAADA